MTKVLFILHQRENYGGYGYSPASGLNNSAQFVSDMLVANGIESKVVQVVDGNGIDKEVFSYRPTHVILEAIWVTPAKLRELKPLHPTVKWIVRIHSELAFLAQDGVALQWLIEYAQIKDVFISANSKEADRDLNEIVFGTNPEWDDAKVAGSVVYLPNFYPVGATPKVGPRTPKGQINIGCFGAIRPFKNQLMQALAAISYANARGLQLFFHINSERAEQGGEAVLKNIRALFADSPPHQLVEHKWMTHDEFLVALQDINLVMQVSLSETFCIVAADAVSMDIPIVVSKEVPWASNGVTANPYSVKDIVAALTKVNEWPWRGFWSRLNRRDLSNYSHEAKEIWLKYFRATSAKK